ncbi:hypothetical protein Tco_1048199 [Tanacetum coccineum]
MKDLWEATFILGIKIYRDRSKRLIGLSQSAYVDKILKRFKMDNFKRDMILVYDGNPEAELRVDCYCNAGFETNRDDIKSQTRYLNNIASLEAAMEAVWIRKFILGLGIVPTTNKPIKTFCDNSAALLIANEPGVQRGARYYHRRYHYVRECIELGKINLLKVHTADNLVDPFTKASPKESLLNMLGTWDFV